MTRPQIVRADTLDLQDKSSPTAADHSQHPTPPPLGTGPAAPHQEASMRRVDDERSGEEHAFDDDRTTAGDGDDNAAARPNGDANSDGDDGDDDGDNDGDGDGDDEDADMADADVDDDLDDMDRISSSPSISDGGSLPSHSHSNISLGADSSSPTSTPISSPLDSAQECDSSSPYYGPPIHFPLAALAARRLSAGEVPAGGATSRSPYQLSTSPSSFHLSQNSNKTQPADHHHGEYTGSRTTNGPNAATHQYLLAIENRLQGIRQVSDISLMSEMGEEAVRAMLRPIPSPFATERDRLSEDSAAGRCMSPDLGRGSELRSLTATPREDENDEDAWITDSDADSWDLDLDTDDESTDISLSDHSRFIDSGWGGICLQDTEDIDFEFVYALHTFVATVEGQANATKGDTMVLLDDSNSYWWLVRVVKDSSIGYLPAEHIETPTERLARLNKHRNIDLSATMLGDTADKTKNPLKKAMRRRHAKGVTWGENITVEASDYDYSSDEGGDDEDFFGDGEAQAQQGAEKDPEQDDGLKVQPLKVNGAKNDSKSKGDTEGEDNMDNAGDDKEPKSSDEIDGPLDPKVSRNGTLRNTDSFFKDDSTETRKISLTPNLLRDDSSTSTTGSRERGASLESLEKNGFADKVKDDKKKKEKKTGMLSGLFKRKDKKTKGGSDSIDADAEKHSEEFGRSSPQSKGSEDLERTSSAEQAAGPQKQTAKGKLHKSQRSREDSPSKTKGILKTDSPEPPATQTSAAKEPSSDKLAAQSTSTMRLVPPEQEDASKTTLEERERGLSPDTRPRTNSAASKLNPINMLKTQQNGEPRPEKVKKAKQRVQLDDFDSEDEGQADPFADPSMQAPPAKPSEPEASGRLSESPVHVSAADAQPPNKGPSQEKDKEQESDSHPPGLTGDASSQETSSPVSTPTPDGSPSSAQPAKASASAARSPSPTQQPLSSMAASSRHVPGPQKEVDTSPPNSSTSASLPAWSDHSLRTYLDDGSDIRDMLVVINDTTGVVPVGTDHPIMAQLFVEETKTVSGLSNELDSLLNGLLEKRMRRAGKSTPSPVANKAPR
ncbi:hypothetical protein P280DRAFT_512436 [Massarina eburnea CBS 473.64]|uniref:SH3 domain-containing protein n=1 Tax=Massarina eburnea CBS 473.64 TaxID=1395130 RepID=A0A6A6SH34_9PLEO|nr:hypothetical protein P280DRAFT_512436 [Massarina eburnea CBS 473.64]